MKKNIQGFTLIELLLYISLTAIILLSVSAFLAVLLSTRIKNQAIAQVEAEGNQVMELITQTLRNAEGVNSPAAGTTSSTLSIDVLSAALDPTVFDLSSGAIRTKEGGGANINITSPKVSASSLTFTNLSIPSTPGTVRVQFTLSFSSPLTTQEYTYSRSFTGSATLR